MLPTPYIRDLDARVYEPAEDSFLLLDCLELDLAQLQALSFPVVCEIGGGSGIVSAFLRMNVLPLAMFLATDVNPAACLAIKQAMADAGSLGLADVLQMNLLLAVRPHAVDVLVFNPPYVPAAEVPKIPEDAHDEQWLDLALLGGADGMDVTWRVLHSLDHILSARGSAYILFCARNNPEDVKAVMRRRGWAVREVMCRKAGWEVLSVLEFRRPEALPS